MMTSSKIKTILEDVYNISSPMNKWIKLPQVSIIFLAQDGNVYIDDQYIFYFKPADDSVTISYNPKYRNLETLSRGFNDYPHSSKLNFDNIAGFISTSTIGPSGVYLPRPF